MSIKNLDRAAYEAWKKNVELQISAVYVTCPDCYGSGEGTCPHCGNETDCETCAGDGRISPASLLTIEFYLRVMEIEKAMLAHWIKGDAILSKDEFGRVVERRHPLEDLLEEFKPQVKRLSDAPLIVLSLPMTESGV